MSHSIIIIDDSIDCVGLAFPSLVSPLATLKTKADSADANLPNLNTAASHRVHIKLEQIQAWLVERCNNSTNYIGQESQMTDEINGFCDDLDELT